MNATFSMSHRRSGNPGFRATNVYRWFGMQSFGLSALACGLAPACRDTAAIFCPDSCMRHAWSVAALVAVAALAACAGESGRIHSGDIEVTRRTAEADDWSRHLPQIYDGLMTCLRAHPSQPAYAANVVPQNQGMLLVEVAGADGSRQECRADAAGSKAPELASATGESQPGPIFTPANMPEPFQRCGSNDPVFHRDGRLLGWVTHFRADCHAGGPAAQQNWRAFGNEPAWSVRVTADAIIFDRFGQAPVRYPSRPPEETSERWTWQLEAPDGKAGNHLELVILNTPCGDTMADRRFDYRAEALFGGQRLRGCAEKLSPIP